MEHVSLLELFEEIKAQSNYSFFFDQDKIKDLDRITLKKSNVSVENVLQEVLAGSGLTYVMVDDVIVIKNEDVVNVKQQKKIIKITGTVFDAETKQTLPGVNVIVKGKLLGATIMKGNLN